MFGLSIGWFEIFFISCVALMVLGPERFPQVAKLTMKTFRDIRKYMSDAQREITTELNPMKDELSKFSKVDIENYLEGLIDDEKEENSIGDQPWDEFAYEDDSMLTPDEYDNPDEWFQNDELEDDMPDKDKSVTGSESVEESVAYNPVRATEEIDDFREEIVDENDPERLDG